MTSRVATALGLLLCLAACGDAPPATEAPKVNGKAPVVEAPHNPGSGTVPADPQPDAEAMEKDPNATDSVTVVDTQGKAPDGAEHRGEFRSALSWTDKYGKHAVVFGRTEHEGESSTTSMLVADFQSFEGDAWVSQRQFKERVEKCEFDTTLTEFVGPWSVTDLDENGVAEVTFAWRAGCRSDVSALTHKVLVVGFDAEARVAKYVLRGTSGIEIAGTLDPASSFKADKAFDEAPAAFRKHAEEVWAKTSTETF